MPTSFLLSLVACLGPRSAPPAEAPFASIEASEVLDTVASVRIDAPEDATAWVEVREDGGSVRIFPAAPGEEGQEAVVAGLAAGVDVEWRAVATHSDGEEVSSDWATYGPGVAPLWLPPLTLTVAPEDPDAGGFVLTTILGETPSVAVLDRRGRYVWWMRTEEGTIPCQAREAREGGGFVILAVDGGMIDDLGAIHRVALTGHTLASTRAPLAHHDFVELEDGRYAYLAVDQRRWEGEDVVGDSVVLLSPESGETGTLWSTWDDLEPDLEGLGEFYGLGADWTHANGLLADPVTGDWLVSLHNLDTLVRLSPDGRLRWQLGGEESDFDLRAGAPFAMQHSPVLTESGVLLFDNGAPDSTDAWSRAAEYRVDEATGSFEEIWSYEGDRQLFSAFMGSAERLPDGGTLVGWGAGGRISEVSSEGEVLWQVDAAVGSPFGFTHALATLGETRP